MWRMCMSMWRMRMSRCLCEGCVCCVYMKGVYICLCEGCVAMSMCGNVYVWQCLMWRMCVAMTMFYHFIHTHGLRGERDEWQERRFVSQENLLHSLVPSVYGNSHPCLNRVHAVHLKRSIHTHTHKHTHTHTYTHADTHTHTNTHMHMYTSSCTRTQTHTHTQHTNTDSTPKDSARFFGLCLALATSLVLPFRLPYISTL